MAGCQLQEMCNTACRQPCGDRLCKTLFIYRCYTANNGQGRHACCAPRQRVQQLGFGGAERRALAVLVEGDRQRPGHSPLVLAVKRADYMNGAGESHNFSHRPGSSALWLPHPPLAALEP